MTILHVIKYSDVTFRNAGRILPLTLYKSFLKYGSRCILERKDKGKLSYSQQVEERMLWDYILDRAHSINMWHSHMVSLYYSVYNNNAENKLEEVLKDFLVKYGA
jgi:hypothetical protein